MAVTPLRSVAGLPQPEPRAERAAPEVVAPERAYGAEALIAAYRVHGHRAATIDPLSERKDPFEIAELDPRSHGLLLGDSAALPVNLGGVAQVLPLSELLERLRASYCGTLAIECAHVRSDEQRRWLYARIEAIPNASRLTDSEAKRVLAQLVAAEVFEHHRREAYPQYKQFNLEGGESFVPLMRALVEEAARHGAGRIVLAMPHRGRLNVMLNALDVPPQRLLSLLSPNPDLALAAHDLRDHAGLESRIETDHGSVDLVLLHNPSHLEAVVPVACGMARALQDRTAGVSVRKVLPVLVHGDASFCGQGVVAETFNMSQTRGYGVGGTVHVILDNQIGSTVSHPADQRSTLYCADLARAFDVPILRVNADDAEAVITAAQLAIEFRMKFAADIVIDHVGYRRYGHFVGDDPTLTQPATQRRIEQHACVVSLYASMLMRRGAIDERCLQQIKSEARAKLMHARPGKPGEAVWAIGPQPRSVSQIPAVRTVRTGVPVEALRALVFRLASVPPGFDSHPMLERMTGEWRAIASGEDRLVDWRLAENLAYGTLLANGFNVRLTGLDAGRGTFCHRQHVWHDQKANGDWSDIYVPLRNVADRQGIFSIFESPLSEESVVGFEYGYSLSCGRDLVLWEGQFGDFVNNAQVMIDQFVVSGASKWGYESGLTMLLPHGDDGWGPEHSCAFLGRFLQLCADENIRVALPSTAAQLYHLLRRQALHPARKPLVVMTPKPWFHGYVPSYSRLSDLAEAEFRALLAEDAIGFDASAVLRVVLTSGKFYYDLRDARVADNVVDVPVLRAEELYPFPLDALGEALAYYPRVEQVVWAQEEPKNHGAWYLVREQLESALPAGVALSYAGRPPMGPSAICDMVGHADAQRAIARIALGTEPTASTKPSA